MGATRDCKHGQLARSCEICGLEADLESQAEYVKELQARLAWLQKTLTACGPAGGAVGESDESGEATMTENTCEGCPYYTHWDNGGYSYRTYYTQEQLV